jgi:hypothetical protein
MVAPPPFHALPLAARGGGRAGRDATGGGAASHRRAEAGRRELARRAEAKALRGTDRQRRGVGSSGAGVGP